MKIQAAFHAPDNKAHIYKTNAINEDIRTYLESIFPRNVKQCKAVEKIFKGKNELQTAHLIWKFLKNYAHYRKDPSHNQIIREVAYFVNRGNLTGDCKTFATFARSIYAAIYPDLGTAFQYAGYAPDAIKPSHVYTVVKDRAGNKIIIDGCYTKFNAEKKYTLALEPKYKAMQVTSLSGLSTNKEKLQHINDHASQAKRERIMKLARCRKDLQLARAEFDAGVRTKQQLRSDIAAIQMEMNGIGKLTPEQKAARKAKRKKANEKAKKGLKKFGWGVAFINLLPIRAAFTAIVAMNANAFANNLKYVYDARNDKTKKEWAKIEKIWYGVGGLKKALLKAIELGVKHKPIFLSKKRKAKFEARKKGMADYIGAIWAYDGEGVHAAPVIAAALAAAAGIIAALIPAVMSGLGKLGKKKDQETVREDAQEVVQQYQQNPASVRKEIEEGADQQTDEMENEEDPTINEMGTEGTQTLFNVLGQVAQVGIKAAGDAVAKKAAKKPKLKKFIDNAGAAAEDYTTGVYLRKSGYTKTAKGFLANSNKYLLYGGAAVVTGLLGYLVIKKK